MTKEYRQSRILSPSKVLQKKSSGQQILRFGCMFAVSMFRAVDTNKTRFQTEMLPACYTFLSLFLNIADDFYNYRMQYTVSCVAKSRCRRNVSKLNVNNVKYRLSLACFLLAFAKL